MSSETKEKKEEKPTEEKGKVGLLGATAQGLAYSAPALSILATYVLVYRAGFTYNAASLAYLIAGIAIILTAVSFAEMVKAYPTRGSVWDFVSGSTNPKFGLFTTWIYLLTIIVAPAASLLPVGFFIFDWLGFPSWIAVLISVIMIMTIVGAGIKLSVRLMIVLLLVELGILFAFAFAAIGWSMDQGIFTFLGALALSPEGSFAGWAGVVAGGTIAMFGYMGFESPATLVEEAKVGKKTIPRAIVLGAVLVTVIYFFLAWAYTLAIPSAGPLTLYYGVVNPIPILGQTILGDPWLGLLNLAGIVAGVTCGIAATTASSRLLSKLGSDKILPGELNISSKRFKTPIIAILVVSIIVLILAEFLPWEIIAYLLPTGALPAFLITNFICIWHYRKDGLNLKNVLLHGAIPAAGMAMCAWFIITGLPVNMQMLLLLWIGIGAVFVTAVNVFRPKVLIAEQSGNPGNPSGNPGEPSSTPTPKVRPISWIAFGISILALLSIIGLWIIWYPLHSGGALWWHHFFPYVSGSIVAPIVVLIVAAAIVGATGYLVYMYRKRRS